VYGAPESFLVNPEGVVVHKYVGALTVEAWESQFLPLINKKS
jgi:cytochrome c biogenesis protein CcmG/thiol:disulfide interchange protein DsbE